ncbi:MAG: preprotein translocase subunit SecG [Candidatus Aminicenantes bacterium]|nr:preprotein translocase subunit SecG [Candidatus Aminicenantes bacterium]
MNTLLIVIHIINCLVLILAVLLQSGKSADLAGAFGGVGSQTAFGSRGTASLLSKMTQACAIIFMLTSLGLWAVSAKGTKSVVSGEQAPQTTTAPATQPAAPPAETPAQPPPEKKEGAAATAEKKPPASQTSDPAKKK